jgi:hypothetical protein
MSATKGPAASLDKIRSDKLRQDAAETPSESHVVLVELDVPQPHLEVMPSEHGLAGRKRFRLSSPAGTDKTAGDGLAKMQQQIENIIGRKPEQFFASSGTFVLSATGKQLQGLANLPFVTAIWPNTRR